MTKRRKWIIGLLVLLGLLIVARILLPVVVKKILNERLQEIDPYVGHISDVDMHLYRGAYVIDTLVIEKIGSDVREPFVAVPKIDLAIEWKSLFKGALVGQVKFLHPTLTFAMVEDTTQNQLGDEFDWTELVKDFMPIQINSLQAVQVKTYFLYQHDTFREKTYLFLDSVELSNIRNVDDPNDPFPSKFFLRGQSMTHKGSIAMHGQANFLRRVPDFDYNLAAEKIELTTLNPWFKYSTGMDFERGTLAFYSEMVAKDGLITGYFKPIMEDARIFKIVEKDRSFWQGVKEFFAEVGQELLENRKLETTGSKIPISGNLQDPQTTFWPTFVGFVRNAYWRALVGTIDNSIAVDDVAKLSQQKPQHKNKHRSKNDD